MKQSLTLFALLALATGLTSRAHAEIGPYANPAPVTLATSANYTILAETAITNTIQLNTAIVGSVGISPNGASSITNMTMTEDPSDAFWTSPFVTGDIYASDNVPPTPSQLSTAVTDMTNAYTYALSEAVENTNQSGGILDGLTLGSGVYAFNGASGNVTIGTGGSGGSFDLTLNGSSTDVWIFQIAGTLQLSANHNIILTGGALAKNVYWAVANDTTLFPNSNFTGTILDSTQIVMQTGATLNGQALAQSAVTLDAGKANPNGVPPGVLGTPTTSPSASATGTGTPTLTPNGSLTATETGTPTATPNGSLTATETGTRTGTPTPTPTHTGSRTASPTPTPSPSRTATATSTPTATPTFPGTATASPTRTLTFTASPTSTVTPCHNMGNAAWGDSYIYPSPARGDSASIAYAMKQDGNVTIKIYNQTGRLVDTITESKSAGWQAAQVSVGKFAQGTYYYLVYFQYPLGTTEMQGPCKFVVIH
jgi:hypothetical protein